MANISNIIFQQGNVFWIEAIESPRFNINSNAVRTETVTLKRAGTFLGCSAVMDYAQSAINSVDLVVCMRDPSNGALVYGTHITEVTLRMVNGSGATRQIGAHALVFMRGTKS